MHCQTLRQALMQFTCHIYRIADSTVLSLNNPSQFKGLTASDQKSGRFRSEMRTLNKRPRTLMYSEFRQVASNRRLNSLILCLLN